MEEKRKKLISILLMGLLLTGVVLGNLGWPPVEAKAAGSGTVDNPIIITTAQQFNNMRNNIYLHYRLGNDIDLSGFPYWTPIGTDIFPFSGSLDGNGYRVSNLTVNQEFGNYLGLFGYLKGQVRNLQLIDINVTGRDYVGGLVGVSNYATIENCSVSGVVKAGNRVGGLAGVVESWSLVKDSSADVDVSGNSYVGGLIGFYDGPNPVVNNSASGDVESVGGYAGGLIGHMSLSRVTNSHASGNVTGRGTYSDYVGGLIGYSSSNQLEFSYATGNIITESSFAGGLVGGNSGKIQKSYATGNVTANGFSSTAGGLVGSSDYNSSSIKDSYATGQVTGGAVGGTFGGLVGKNHGVILNSYSTGGISGSANSFGGLVGSVGNFPSITGSYYDRETTGQSDTGKGQPKTTAEMMAAATFAGWDFNSVWSINEGVEYPKLRPYVATYAVTYNGNGHTEGAVPTDGNSYPAGGAVTVLGNSGALARSGFVFAGWNTRADGSGQAYVEGSSLNMSAANLTLYALWAPITYTVTSLQDQTLTALAVGYLSGMQETRTITVTRTGTGDLFNLKLSLGGKHPEAFVIEGPGVTTLNAGTPSTTFTIKAKDHLAADVYNATVTLSADHLNDVTFTVEQSVKANEEVKGDANGDGIISAADGLLLTKYLAGKLTLTPAQMKALDMNGDGKVDSLDYDMLKAIYLNSPAG